VAFHNAQLCNFEFSQSLPLSQRSQIIVTLAGLLCQMRRSLSTLILNETSVIPRIRSG